MNISPKLTAFSNALARSKLCLECGVAGSARSASTNARIPSGTLKINNHCQGATARIAAAKVGPAADDVATISAVMPTPRPSWERG